MAAMVPMGIDFWASRRSPERLEPAMIPEQIVIESQELSRSMRFAHRHTHWVFYRLQNINQFLQSSASGYNTNCHPDLKDAVKSQSAQSKIMKDKDKNIDFHPSQRGSRFQPAM